MGQGVSAETEPTGLKEILGKGTSAVSWQAEQAFSPLELDAHHIKAWRFATRGNCFVEAPVSLCDRQGSFSAQLHRSSSYVILHIQGSSASAVPAVGSTALRSFAATAGAVCTPRGLALPEIQWHEIQPWPGLRYEIFVWHGRGTESVFRANVLRKAYALDSLLRKSLPTQFELVESIRRAAPMKDMAADESVSTAEAASVNGLLANLAASPERRIGTCQWPRLGRAIRKDFGMAQPTQANGCSEKVEVPPPASLPSKPKPGVPPLALGACLAGGPQSSLGGAVQSTTPASTATSTSAPTVSGTTMAPQPVPSQPGRPVVPPLALGALQPAAARPSSGRPSPTATTATTVSSSDSSEGMEVDDASSSSRKRQRGGADDDASPQRTSQSARAGNPPGAITFPTVTAAAGPARSARTEGVPSLSLPGRSGAPSQEASGAPRVPALGLAKAGGHPPPVQLGQAADRQSGRQAPRGGPILNLEDIHTPEEELINTYDPDNEENNFHLPDHLQRRLQLKHFRQVCSEVIPSSLYIASYQVACDEEALHMCGITHIVNTAADICDSCFPDKFQYITYYLKDANSEDISSLLYRTLEWMYEAIGKGGRVLVHCREGVSRSATFVIAYLMWWFNLSFEAAHERIRQVRPICNPNTGFTCQLLQLAKRLSSSPGGAAPIMSDRASLFRVAPYHPKEPFLLLVPAERQPGPTKFDPRFGWVAHAGLQFILWMGAEVHDPQLVRQTVEAHKRRVEFFEKCQCSLLVMQQGEDAQQLWQLLGEAPPSRSEVATHRPEFDADHEIMVSTHGRGGAAGTSFPSPAAAPGSTVQREDGRSANPAWEASGAGRPPPILAVGR